MPEQQASSGPSGKLHLRLATSTPVVVGFFPFFLVLTVLISTAGLEGVVSSKKVEVLINLSRYANIVFDTLYY